MKRAKQRGSGGSSRDADVESSFWKKPAEPERTWDQHMDGRADEDFAPYALTATYAKGQLVTHAKFGRGVVVEVEPSRVEILFQEGKKKLGHGQTA